MSIKICSKCKTSFECCNEKMGCWCEDLSIDIKTLNELKKTYDNCLCPKCLTEYSNNNPII
jgi:hypothetical protein